MTHAPTVRQILSDNDAGLLPYLRHQLQKEEFSHFRAQLGFHVDEFCTQISKSDDFSEAQTTLKITLKILIAVDSQTYPDDATLQALEFQHMLDALLINWSQHSSALIKPISEIKGTFSNLEEIPYHGGYLPGFEIQCKFTLTYSAVVALLTQEEELTKQRESTLYRSGDRTPISGQYELINSDGESTGQEVTSTQNHPFPPTPEPNQSYKLVDPTQHKKRTRQTE